MATRTLGIIIHGATGRIGWSQHLANSLVPIIEEGGLLVGGDRVIPKLMLVARDEGRLKIAAAKSGAAWTTDLDTALVDPTYEVFCDAAATHLRPFVLEKAMSAGKHIYTEKPLAPSVAEGQRLLHLAEARGVKHGAVEDKLGLPGLQKIARLVERGFFGRLIGFKLEFGWWIFDGIEAPAQRPSWNYQKSGGGGVIFDMYPHWRYVVEGLLGPIRRVTALAATGTRDRVDEAGQHYVCDVEDTGHALVQMENGAVGVILSSWSTRVRRDDLVVLQIDGSKGSAQAGLHRCFTQSSMEAPRTSAFSVSADAGIDYRTQWREFDEPVSQVNPYRAGWEAFLRHLGNGEPMMSDLRAGIRDIALAEACHRSIASGAWAEMPAIAAK